MRGKRAVRLSARPDGGLLVRLDITLHHPDLPASKRSVTMNNALDVFRHPYAYPARTPDLLAAA